MQQHPAVGVSSCQSCGVCCGPALHPAAKAVAQAQGNAQVVRWGASVDVVCWPVATVLFGMVRC